ncbi:MAG: hypothetical protein Q4D90_02640, partial [bacterium]|nr:hypothetical protein [bacterium]
TSDSTKEVQNAVQSTDINKLKQKTKKNDAYASQEKAEPRVLFASDSFEMRCVDRLSVALKQQLPNAKVPATPAERNRWASEIERMKRLDGRSETEIEEALQFATSDSFWRTTIRSTAKLREKCETLLLQNRKRVSKSESSNGRNRFHNFEQHDYDYDDMMWQSVTANMAEGGKTI